MTRPTVGRWLRLLAFVLAVPLVGAGIATVLRDHADASFAFELQQSASPGGPPRKTPLTLAELCAGPDADSYQACNGDAGYRLFAGASFAAGAGGLALLGGIALAGAVARTDRRLLLALFRPGLYVMATFVTGLIAIHAIIATVALFAGVQAVLPGTPMFFGGVILAGALAGIRAVPRALFGAVRETRAVAFGGRVTRQDAPRLWALVEATAARLGARPPDDIVLALDTTFFAIDAPVATPNGACLGRTLCCSLPLARILTVDEFTSIVAHELAHFRREDTAFRARFSSIYRGTTDAIVHLATVGGGGRSIALWPALATFDFFLERFAAAERRHSRDSELVADAAAAEATSARAVATALVKTHAFGPLWPQAFEQAAQTVVDPGGQVPNAGAIFAADAGRAAEPSLLEGILERETAHPIDSHPSLAVRLSAIGIALADVSADALQVDLADPAASLAPVGVLHEQALSMIVVASRQRPPASD